MDADMTIVQDQLSAMQVNGHSKGIDKKYILHVECRLKTLSTADYKEVSAAVKTFIQEHMESVIGFEKITGFDHVSLLKDNIELLIACEANLPDLRIHSVHDIDLVVHVYQVNEELGIDEFTEDSEVISSNIWDLPARGLESLWQSLVFNDDIPDTLLRYVHAAIRFSDSNMDANIVTCNRLVLLHGPPGTGKTSLCRALAQKIAVRFHDRFPNVKLVEINAHSLFSKWFSESGKLVMKMFQQINELLEDDRSFVCVLIDEVESLTAARQAALSGSEPSDSLRVVNALLTQLDKLGRQKNVLIITTSNLPKAVDEAFLDRADIKMYIGLPSREAHYKILRSIIEEMYKKGLVVTETPLDDEPLFLDFAVVNSIPRDRRWDQGGTLARSTHLEYATHGLLKWSGRSVRRLPLLVYASCLEKFPTNEISIEAFLQKMARATPPATPLGSPPKNE